MPSTVRMAGQEPTTWEHVLELVVREVCKRGTTIARLRSMLGQRSGEKTADLVGNAASELASSTPHGRRPVGVRLIRDAVGIDVAELAQTQAPLRAGCSRRRLIVVGLILLIARAVTLERLSHRSTRLGTR